MPERALIEQLDEAIQTMLTIPEALVDRELGPYIAIARTLRDLPHPSFKVRLKADLHGRTPMNVATESEQPVEDVSVEEMLRRVAAPEAQPQPRGAATFMPQGFRTVTPYLVVKNAPALVDFTVRVFGAGEAHRTIGPDGSIHAEVRVGDSMLMIGGGHEGRPLDGAGMPTALHVYVENTDAVYERALVAGATSMGSPVDQAYGERSAAVADPSGNVWYIATATGERHIPAGLHAVNVYLHPLRAEPLITFMERAFGATPGEKYTSPDGVVHHATVTIGDSVVEMGEAHGPYQPMPTMFYLYLPDVDASYRRALEAGAVSLSEPADQPYGDRVGAVKDAFGNHWRLATLLRETRLR
jgi:PhnB protein